MNIYRKLINLITEAPETELDTEHGIIPADDSEKGIPKDNVKKYGRKFRRPDDTKKIDI